MLRPIPTSLLLGLLVPLLVTAAGAEPVAWHGWNEGLAAAAGGGKPVIVDVYTDWCGWCKRMDRDVYAKAAIGDYLNQHFVMVRLNAESAERVSYGGRTMTARAGGRLPGDGLSDHDLPQVRRHAPRERARLHPRGRLPQIGALHRRWPHGQRRELGGVLALVRSGRQVTRRATRAQRP